MEQILQAYGIPKETVTALMMLYTYFTNTSARVGYDTRSIFKRSLTGLNAEFSFS